jgi:hypothetical protein
MKFSLWTQYGALNSQPVFSAFKKGAENLGYECALNDHNSDIDVIWSVLFHGRMTGNKAIWDRAKAKNKNVIVLEVGGIKRGTTWKVGLNGINRDAYFGELGNSSDRANSLNLSCKPWRRHGDYVLICGQHDKSLQWNAMPRMSSWVIDIIEQVQRFTTRPILFRPHPRCPLHDIEHQFKNVFRQNPNKMLNSYDDYDLSFAQAHAVISHSSNPGPQAILAGVPAFVSTSSLAYEAANDIDFLHDIEEPIMPDRQQWLNDYAYTEYTIEEIAQGIPLKNLTLKL